jgi:hypothetical protein
MTIMQPTALRKSRASVKLVHTLVTELQMVHLYIADLGQDIFCLRTQMRRTIGAYMTQQETRQMS